MFTEPTTHEEVIAKVQPDTRIGEVFTPIMGTHAHTHQSVLDETLELQESFYSLLSSLYKGGEQSISLLEDTEEELSDVTFTQLSLFYSQGLISKDTELRIGVYAARKFFHRKIFLKNVLDKHGVEVNVDHFHNGSNWAKPEKIQKALKLHGLKMNKPECIVLSKEYKALDFKLFETV